MGVNNVTNNVCMFMNCPISEENKPLFKLISNI